MSTLDFDIDSQSHATVSLNGEIVSGDAARFQQFVDEICLKYEKPEMPLAITVALNSCGGDYCEGLLLGDLFCRRGYATLVRKDAECYSAAALAFLGGAYLGAVGGWGADRTLEVGGVIGFHGFYSDSLDSTSLSDGMEQGKVHSILVMNYATALRIDIDFMAEGLEKGPAELLILRTVDHFRKLGVKLKGAARTSILTDEAAVNVANYATGWKRPVALQPRVGEARAFVRQLTAHDYRRAILRRLVDQPAQRGPLIELIQKIAELGDDRAVSIAYRDLEHVNALPYLCPEDDDRIVHVSGFDFGGGFYATDCFIKPSNDKAADFGVTVVVCHTSNYFRTANYSHAGDCLYEVHRPDEVL
ncbi:MAG: hypothetical protein SXG53_17005 [Pseudomonadota bacterium]|nr:hypothetical protein [Pseudomonadota bacterium]